MNNGIALKLRALLLLLMALTGCSPASTGGPVATSAVTAATAILPTARVTAPIRVVTCATDSPAHPSSTPVAPATAVPPRRPTTSATAVPPANTYSYPISLPGRAPGDGFFIRDAYAVENIWYNPSWWHTGEDWYVQDGSSVGAQVYAAVDGEVIYAGANYPGRVVIIQHADRLFSMYGHLDLKLAAKVGQQVARGDLLGTVRPGWDRALGQFHFEIRTFLTATEVNGTAPRYHYRCGVNGPPGPGYWPSTAPDHPSEIGWRNPAHVIARHTFTSGVNSPLGEVVVTTPVSSSVTLWSHPPAAGETHQTLGKCHCGRTSALHCCVFRPG